MPMDVSMMKSALFIFEHAFNILHTPFNIASKILSRGGAKTQRLNRDAALFIPIVVLLNFAIELAFKILIIQEGNTFRYKHDLKSLFEDLSDASENKIKDSVKRKMNISDVRINQYITDNNNGFADWRYFFQKNGLLKADLLFLKTLLRTIKGEIK